MLSLVTTAGPCTLARGGLAGEADTFQGWALRFTSSHRPGCGAEARAKLPWCHCLQETYCSQPFSVLPATLKRQSLSQAQQYTPLIPALEGIWKLDACLFSIGNSKQPGLWYSEPITRANEWKIQPLASFWVQTHLWPLTTVRIHQVPVQFPGPKNKATIRAWTEQRIYLIKWKVLKYLLYFSVSWKGLRKLLSQTPAFDRGRNRFQSDDKCRLLSMFETGFYFIFWPLLATSKIDFPEWPTPNSCPE